MGISVSDYLISRLQKLGVSEFFGLPGDYNFNILKSVENNPETNWIGCTNELNAGYAADGYARIKGYGALITTYGVGELSAINAIAGSMSEFVPVMKITGIPATKNIEENRLIHHNLNTPDYHAFIKAYSNVVEAAAFLTKYNAKEEIDRLINVMVKEKKPVYLALPVDVCNEIIEEDYENIIIESNKDSLNQAVLRALEIINTAQNPSVLADVMIKRFNAKEEFYKFLENTNYPVSTLLMGKDLLNFESPNYSGTYVGAFDNPMAYKSINNSDCPIFIGTVISDINTQGFSLKFNPDDYINIQGNYTVIKNTLYKDVLMKDMLSELSKSAKKLDENCVKYDYYYHDIIPDDKKLHCDYFYQKMQYFLREGDNLICETGLINLALAKLKLKKNISVNNQILWGSIGWATGAALGSALADKNARTVLITGEGSHQLSAQEVSTMMRNNLKPVIFVINNDGYTIERILSDNPMDEFNNIAKWNYTKLPYVFGSNVYSASVKSDIELDKVLDKINTEQKDKLCYIELCTDMFDMPELAKKASEKLKLKN